MDNQPLGNNGSTLILSDFGPSKMDMYCATVDAFLAIGFMVSLMAGRDVRQWGAGCENARQKRSPEVTNGREKMEFWCEIR